MKFKKINIIIMIVVCCITNFTYTYGEENKDGEILVETKNSKKIGCWPLPGHTYISSSYGERIHPVTKEVKKHKGVDIPAPIGTDIVSIDRGEVIFSGEQSGYGNVIIIKHHDNKTSLYAHNSQNSVQTGDKVSKGSIIGKIGETGVSTGPHLHLEIKINEIDVDPLMHLDSY